MMNGKLMKCVGLTAVLSLIVWIILTPFMATIWSYDNGRLIWERQPLLVRTIGQWLAEQGASTFDTEEAVYFFYGRYFFIVYLLIIPTLIVFQKRYQGSQRTHRILLYTFLVAGLADFTSYGLGVFSQTLWKVGFGVEMLVLLVIIVVSVIYGRYLLQRPATPRWLGWLLIITTILASLMLFEPFLAGYWPNSPVLPLVLAWAVIGTHLWLIQRKTVLLEVTT